MLAKIMMIHFFKKKHLNFQVMVRYHTYGTDRMICYDEFSTGFMDFNMNWSSAEHIRWLIAKRKQHPNDTITTFSVYRGFKLPINNINCHPKHPYPRVLHARKQLCLKQTKMKRAVLLSRTSSRTSFRQYPVVLLTIAAPNISIHPRSTAGRIQVATQARVADEPSLKFLKSIYWRLLSVSFQRRLPSPYL